MYETLLVGAYYCKIAEMPVGASIRKQGYLFLLTGATGDAKELRPRGNGGHQSKGISIWMLMSPTSRSLIYNTSFTPRPPTTTTTTAVYRRSLCMGMTGV